jgi:hypothetical protein
VVCFAESRQEVRVADQWVKLTSSDEDDEGETFYANLAHAISIWPNGKGGSLIWYVATGEMTGQYSVQETPEQILQKRGAV